MKLESLSVLSFIDDEVIKEKLHGQLLNLNIYDVEAARDLAQLEEKYLMIFPHVIIVHALMLNEALYSLLQRLGFTGVIITLCPSDKLFSMRKEIGVTKRQLFVATPLQQHDLYEKLRQANLYLKHTKHEFVARDEYNLPQLATSFNLPLQYISESKIVIESPIRFDNMNIYAFKSRLFEFSPLNNKMMVVGVSAITRARSFYISLYLKFLGEEVLKRIRQKVAV